jgi:hypothetical protein
MVKVRQGTKVRLLHWYSKARVLYDPTTPVVSIYDPSGTILIDSGGVSLSSRTPTKITPGYYYYEFTLKADAVVGRSYYAVFGATADVSATQEAPQPQFFEVIANLTVPYYADVDAAAAMSGLEVYKIDAGWLEEIDEIIHSKTGGVKFKGVVSVTEYIDIRNPRQKTLILGHFPVTEVAEVINDAQSTDSTILRVNAIDDVDADTDVVWYPHGRLEFRREGITGETVGEFGYGRFIHCVRVTYKYGYAEIPQLIMDAATALLARIAIISKKESDAQTTLTGIPFLSISSIRVADFALNFDSGDAKYRTKYDDEVQTLLDRVERTYKNKVTFA